jgi:hypothetical protein
METTLEIYPETRDQKFSRPFASPAFAACILGCTSHRAADYIHDGTIPLSFDIKGPGKQRHCIRVATANVVARKNGLEPSFNVEKFLDAAFASDRRDYSAPALGCILQCNAEHIYHLISAKALSDAGNWSRYRIPRESIIKFLLSRRVA